MRIKLKNFRCYTDKEFDFGDNGITLITGLSGVGKTTIILAIQFALFDKGTKLITYGKTSCSVELYFDNIKIVRTKKPNRLIVNDIYEDDAGQEIINELFGVTFETTGYISQNGLNSFINMSPIEKLAFLEKFAFKDADIDGIKSRCKSYINKCNEELISVTSQLELLRNLLSSQEKPEHIDFPIKCKKENRDIIIKNENTGLKNADILIKKSLKNIKLSEKELCDLKIYLTNISNKKDNIKDIENKLTKIEEKIIGLNFDTSFDINYYESCLKNILLNNELVNLEKSYKENLQKLEKIKNEEIEQYKKQITEYEKTLWKEYSKEQIENDLSDYNEVLQKMKELKKYRKELENVKVNKEFYEEEKLKYEKLENELDNWKKIYIKLKEQENIYSCPKCSCNLRFVNKKLTESNEKIIDEYDLFFVENTIEKLKKDINILEKQIKNIEYNIKLSNNISENIQNILDNYEETDIDEIESSILYLQEYKKDNKNNEVKLHKLKYNLENNVFSTSYNTYNSLIKKDEKRIEELKNLNKNNAELDENEIRKIISDYKSCKQSYDMYTNEKNSLLKEIEKNNKYILEYENQYKKDYENINDIEYIEKLISKYNEELDTYKEKRKKHENNLSKISEWQEYNIKLEKYEKMLKQLNDLEINEKELKDKYLASVKLKEKVLEAETVSLLNIIDTINTHVHTYLEAFFVDNPINIRLSAFKETKKSTKPQINLEIDYKSMECDLNTLSGGEQARVVLAFTLALAEIFNTPLMLLDECVASLDQETTGIVFDAIREHYKGKLSIVIAHQVVMGHFDKILKIE